MPTFVSMATVVAAICSCKVKQKADSVSICPTLEKYILQLN